MKRLAQGVDNKYALGRLKLDMSVPSNAQLQKEIEATNKKEREKLAELDA